MLKSGSTWPEMPSRVRNVRMRRMMYGGEYLEEGRGHRRQRRHQRRRG